jgi:hypothetical protein
MSNLSYEERLVRINKMNFLKKKFESNDPLIKFTAAPYFDEYNKMQTTHTEILFETCKKYDLKYILIEKYEICGCEKHRFNNWPTMWKICDEIGIHAGCGNNDQCQTIDSGIFFTPETYGAWDLKERHKLTDDETLKLNFQRVVSRRR